jgi:hypothetical protein
MNSCGRSFRLWKRWRNIGYVIGTWILYWYCSGVGNNKPNRKLENNNRWNGYFGFYKIITVRPRNISCITKFSCLAADTEVNESIFKLSAYFSKFCATFWWGTAQLWKSGCLQLTAVACSFLDNLNWTLIKVVRGRGLMTIVIPSQLAQLVTFITSPNLGYKIGGSWLWYFKVCLSSFLHYIYNSAVASHAIIRCCLVPAAGNIVKWTLRIRIRVIIRVMTVYYHHLYCYHHCQ